MTRPAYAEADRLAGVQGDVTVRGIVQPDGTIADVAIAESSRSPALDEASLAAVRQWTFAPVEAPTDYQVEIEYRKDDLNTLATKTCADLNLDVAYFRGAFPEAPVSDMPLKDVLVGMMMVTNRGGMSVETIRRSSEAFDRTVEWCSTRSNELMLERYVRFAR
jgi:TonB family protein